MKTIGISPKVSIPTLLLAAVGIVLVFTGDTNTGITLLLAAAGVGSTGALASPGNVVAPIPAPHKRKAEHGNPVFPAGVKEPATPRSGAAAKKKAPPKKRA